jgi:hypothetical protein
MRWQKDAVRYVTPVAEELPDNSRRGRFSIVDDGTPSAPDQRKNSMPDLNDTLHDFFQEVLKMCNVKCPDRTAASAEELDVTLEDFVAAALSELIHQRFTVLDGPGNGQMNFSIPNTPLEIRILVGVGEPTPAITPKGLRRTPSP